MTENVILEKANGIGIIKINRPKKVNSMSVQCLKELYQAFINCKEDINVRVIILTGSGNKAFSSGGNLIDELEFTREECNAYNLEGGMLIKLMINMKKPIIAAINGYALGASIPLICACDIGVASNDAIFGIPTISLGGISGWGTTQVVPKRIGNRNAKYLMIANEHIRAEDALRINLINKVVANNELMNEAVRIAAKIAKYPPKVVSEIINLIDESEDMTIEEGIYKEAMILEELNSRPNFKEGIKAFLEKREPQFNFND